MVRIHRPSRREITSEINIVPLLDVLLVLLLIFIATTPVISNRVEVNLPHISNSKKEFKDANPPVIIEIYTIGQYTLLIDNERIALPSLEHVSSAVKLHLDTNPKTVFLIGSEKDVPYKKVINVLNILHKAGVISIGLMTQSI